MNRAKESGDCLRCHTEHYGEDFNIIKWPTTKAEFDHKLTGYPLLGRHAALACERCHTPKNIPAASKASISKKDLRATLLGLSQSCSTCHKDVHDGQLGTDCQRCHSFDRWKPAQSFDHSKSDFPLTGKHETVPCAKCHPVRGEEPGSMKFKGIEFKICTGCHKDPHQGAFPGACQSCHDTASWRPFNVSHSFDHARTKFPLQGKHSVLRCNECHKTANFRTSIPHARCLDCHKDEHQGQFASRRDGGDCAACHNDASYKPATFSVADHAATAFALKGKHAPVPCAKCHLPKGKATDYHPKFRNCSDCHADVHAGQFLSRPSGNKCEDCHTVEFFKPSTFTLTRHQSTPFALKGAHVAVPCQECHRPDQSLAEQAVRYTFPSQSCGSCHRDPHGGEFNKVPVLAGAKKACESCHQLRSWQELKPFPHERTGYSLAGAHAALACTDCHRRISKPEPKAVTIGFANTPKACGECHEDIHAGQFSTAVGGRTECSKCHNPIRWAAALFDHEKTSFSLSGAHSRVPCRDCHGKTRNLGARRIILYRETPRDCAACHRGRPAQSP